MFLSTKDKYKIGDMVKYEYLKGDFSTAKILALNSKTAEIEIGLPYSKKNDIYMDKLEVPYDKLLPFGVYLDIYENNSHA